jgi:hypothetical protein
MLDRVIFIQMESSVAQNPNEIMYSGQTLINDDLEYMKSRGFEVVSITDYSHQAPPEANVLLYNKRFS